LLDGDWVGEEASGDLDTEECGDLALLREAYRLGTRERQALVVELVPDRRQLSGEQLGHQAERLAYGPFLGDVDRRNSRDPGKLGERSGRLDEAALGENCCHGPATGCRLGENDRSGVGGNAAAGDKRVGKPLGPLCRGSAVGTHTTTLKISSRLVIPSAALRNPS
jgi:hypothetical protein